jgi:hypothetical protein
MVEALLSAWDHHTGSTIGWGTFAFLILLSAGASIRAWLAT